MEFLNGIACDRHNL